MSNRREPQVTRNLQATADLLDALQENPTLLNDEEFMKRLSILREKHEETTNFLAKKLGAPPLPTMISSTSTSKSSKTTTQSRIHMTTSTSCHQIPRHLDLHPKESPKSPKSPNEYFNSENFDMEEEEYHLVERRGRLRHQDSESEYMVPTRHEVRVPVRIAPPVPVKSRRHQIHVIMPQSAPSSSSRASSLPRHQPTVPQSRQRSDNIRQILAEASAKHNLPTASTAMPSGLLLSSTSTKHVPRHPPEFATSSDVVEESFLEDGQSTTREIPTIRDEMVTEHRSVKRQLENGLGQKHRSKSMHNMAEPQVTIPKPFQLSLRKSIGNTYAKKFMSDLMTEKQRQEEAAKIALENTKFKAKPVPKSTYLPTNTFATEQKYVEAMRKKVAAVARKKFEAQSEMFRSKSEGNLASIKPLGYVPPSTYISPIPVRPNARGRSAVTRTAAMIQEATTPKGIKSHRAQSNLTHNLRHGRCKLDTSAVVLHRRTSPPDFNKIHAKINEEYRRTNSKPSTVPIPFKFAHRSPSAPTRHTNCKETPPEQFKPKTPTTKPSDVRIPSTHGAQLREELNRARIQKMRAEETAKNNFWAEDNRKRIASFLGRRSKTEDNFAMRTKMKIQRQQETEQEYMRQLSEMKQRVLNGPLIMEKQTALAQEHRLKRKYEERMKNSKVRSAQADPSRRGSETSAAGTFVVEKNGSSAVTSSRKSESKASSSRSYKKSTSSESEESSRSSEATGSRKVSSRRSESSSSSSESSDSEDNSDESER